MIEMGKKYQTRDGRAVRILCVDRKPNNGYTVVGLVLRPDGTEAIEQWGPKGDYQSSGPYPQDLIPVPTKHEGFIVVGKDGFVWGQNVVSTIGEAIEAGFKKEEGDHIVRVTWED